ncbi:phosphodiesterase/alkaline phosphatase D-like protein [Saccharothrix tamanrassetensis]|uniref:Phosphodiesterase/alkaline phosphatase D-like protein n=1 Tax=Saccharothrix tamanrassetensis TaxID=1051531 RepID=A0A841CE84_9PSEU|nr:hypothetical protein [Saccharothrix tamanrassetensis]MBB5954335.1 phosphodiesterase/alkaline phosphatase D-like protein [Saccharothrix tamanrassetensis]
MSGQSGRRPGRLVASLLNVLLAAAVAALVNVWTSSWSTPVGIGVAVLVVGQGLVLWWTAPRDAESEKVSVDLELGRLLRTTVTGVEVEADDRRSVEVKLTASEVRDGTVYGYRSTGATSAEPNSSPDSRD